MQQKEPLMRRPLIIILILVAVAALYWRFPYAVQGTDDKRHLIYLVLWLLVMVSMTRMSRDRFPNLTRDAAIWTAVVISLVFGYSFRDAPFIRRLTGEIMPQQVQEQGDGSIVVRASQGGHFYIEAKVNDVYVRFMVDTGASDIVLSPFDANRIGIDRKNLSYNRSTSTANGYGSSAGTVIDHLAIGSLHMSHLSASVNKADMDTSLLGMSFLKRLQSFRVEGNTLVLVP